MEAFSRMDKQGLIITLAVLVAEIVLLVVCRIKLKQPADPLKPRIIPYGALMIFLTLGIFVTLAHSISLVTGEQLKPRNKVNQMMR